MSALTVEVSSCPNQFRIVNDPEPGNFDRAYVNFSGYFGEHGPHVFAAAPKLLAALKGALGALEQDYDAGKDMGDADWEGIAHERLQAARVAIAEAEAPGQ